MKSMTLFLSMLLVGAGCDSGASTAKAEVTDSKTDAKPRANEPKVDEPAEEAPAPKDAPAEPKPEPAADGLDPELDNSKLDETGKAIAKLLDASKTCAFDMDSQIRGCKPYDEFRALQRSISPMTKEFAQQRDLAAVTRLGSKEATVRAWSYQMSSTVYRDRPESRTAIESALSEESDTIALLVGLRAVRQHLASNPTLAPVFDKHAKSSEATVAETAQQAIDKAAK